MSSLSKHQGAFAELPDQLIICIYEWLPSYEHVPRGGGAVCRALLHATRSMSTFTWDFDAAHSSGHHQLRAPRTIKKDADEKQLATVRSMFGVIDRMTDLHAISLTNFRLALDDASLAGVITKHVATLHTLSASGSSLRSPSLAIPNLSILDLSKCTELVAPILDCPQLRELDVSRTHVSSTDVARIFKGLPLLRVLRAHGCKNIRDFAEVPRGLEVLDLSATSVNDAAVMALLDALAPPPSSSPLSSSFGGVTSPSSVVLSPVVRDLGSLDDDELVATKFTDDRTPSSSTKGGLDDDDDNSSHSKHDDIPAASLAVLILSDCKELKRPTIQSNTLRVFAIDGCKALKTVVIRCPELRELNVSKTGISDTDLAAIVSDLPELTILRATDTWNLRRPDLSAITIPSLTRVDMIRGALEAEGFVSVLTAAPSLTSFDLSMQFCDRLSDFPPLTRSPLPHANMRKITSYSTPWTDGGVRGMLSAIPFITTMHIGYSPLVTSGTIISPYLTDLNISDTDLHATQLLELFTQCPNLRHLKAESCLALAAAMIRTDTLETLALGGCRNLRSLSILHAPRLQLLELQVCWLLRRLTFGAASENDNVAIAETPTMTAIELAQAAISGADAIAKAAALEAAEDEAARRTVHRAAPRLREIRVRDCDRGFQAQISIRMPRSVALVGIPKQTHADRHTLTRIQKEQQRLDKMGQSEAAVQQLIDMSTKTAQWQWREAWDKFTDYDLEANMFIESQFQSYLKAGGSLSWPVDTKLLPVQPAAADETLPAPPHIPLKPLLFVGGESKVEMPAKATARRQIWYRLDRVDQEYSMDLHVLVQENASTLTRRAVRRVDRVTGNILMNPRYESHAKPIPDGDIDGKGGDGTDGDGGERPPKKTPNDYVRELLSTATAMDEPINGSSVRFVPPKDGKERKHAASSSSSSTDDITTSGSDSGASMEIMVIERRIEDLQARAAAPGLSATAKYGLKKQIDTQRAALLRLRKQQRALPAPSAATPAAGAATASPAVAP